MFLSWGLFHKMFSLYGTLWIHSFYDLKNSTADGAILLLETNGDNFLILGFFFFCILLWYTWIHWRQFSNTSDLYLSISVCKFVFFYGVFLLRFAWGRTPTTGESLSSSPSRPEPFFLLIIYQYVIYDVPISKCLSVF